MRDMPKITVVTPCLNAERTIERTLRSIAEQNYPNLEYLICDGGSTDRTVDLIRRNNSNLTYTLFIEKDKNVADALNKGFRKATGDIFCYLNADDALSPGALRLVADFFDTHPDIDVLTGGCQRVYADGSSVFTKVPSWFLKLLAYKNGIEQPSTFWRSNLHRRAGEFDHHFRLAFDHEWWNRLKDQGARFACVEDVLSTYYFSDSNLTSNAGLRVIEEMAAITRRYAPYGIFVEALYWLLFHLFDMRGYYDVPFRSLSRRKQGLFGAALAISSALFGRDVVNAYNWNWASKQVRGKIWYK
jgi:glycosyltransferase involved in cell wall biosynthesis